VRQAAAPCPQLKYGLTERHGTAIDASDPQLPSGLTHQRSATLACARMQDQIESGVFAWLRAA
jgi:hypothetical protein